MYKCLKCNRRTESIDESPCEKDCPKFEPIEIRTMHKIVTKENGMKVLLCTDKPPRPNATFLGGNYGISCIRCRRKMKEQFKAIDKLYDADEEKTETPISPPENEDDEKTAISDYEENLPEIDETDTLLPDPE